jgi:hypothetical protein
VGRGSALGRGRSRTTVAELAKSAVVHVTVGRPEGVGDVPLACRELAGGVVASVVPIVAAVGCEQLRPRLNVLGGSEPGRLGRGEADESHVRRRHSLAPDIPSRIHIGSNAPPQGTVDGNIIRDTNSVYSRCVARVSHVLGGSVEDFTPVVDDVLTLIPGAQSEETPARPRDGGWADVEAE